MNRVAKYSTSRHICSMRSSFTGAPKRKRTTLKQIDEFLRNLRLVKPRTDPIRDTALARRPNLSARNLGPPHNPPFPVRRCLYGSSYDSKITSINDEVVPKVLILFFEKRFALLTQTACKAVGNQFIVASTLNRYANDRWIAHPTDRVWRKSSVDRFAQCDTERVWVSCRS